MNSSAIKDLAIGVLIFVVYCLVLAIEETYL